MAAYIFKITGAVEKGEPLVDAFDKDGSSAFSGIESFKVDRGPRVYPSGKLTKGEDVVIICGKNQEDNKFGNACKTLRAIINEKTNIKLTESSPHLME